MRTVLLVLLAGCHTATAPLAVDAGAAAAVPQAPVDRVPVWVNKGSAYIDHRGDVVIAGPFESAGEFSEGLAAVEDNKGHAYIDATGRIAFRIMCADAGRFSSGRARIAKRRPGAEHDEIGYIDRSGKVVIAPSYGYAADFSDGLAAVRLPKTATGFWDGKVGYIDTEGREVIAAMFDDAGAFHDGLACAALGSSEGYIDRSGTMVAAAPLGTSPCARGQARKGFADGRGPWKVDGRAGFIDRAGKLVIAARYDRVEAFSEGRAVFEQKKRCGYLDSDGREVIAASYRACGDFSDGLAPVLVGDRWAFIDRAGTTVLPARYNDTRKPPRSSGVLGLLQEGQLRPPRSLGHGLYRVELADWTGLIDGTGRQVWRDD